MFDLAQHGNQLARQQFFDVKSLTLRRIRADTSVVPPHGELGFCSLKCTGRTAALSRFFTCVRLRVSSLGGGGGEGFGLAGLLVRQSANPVACRPPRFAVGRGLTVQGLHHA